MWIGGQGLEAGYSNLNEIRQNQDILSNSNRQLNMAFDALSDQFDEQKRFLERINDPRRIYDKELSEFYEEEYKGCKRTENELIDVFNEYSEEVRKESERLDKAEKTLSEEQRENDNDESNSD